MKKSEEYIRDLESINMETHSRCNMETVHCEECPIVTRSRVFGNFKLEMGVMRKFLIELEGHGYHGLTGLHHYSDPMADKRIFEIVEMCVKYNPSAKFQIWTNGRLLGKEKAERLLEMGIHNFRISAYTQEEYRKYTVMVNELKQSYPDREYEVAAQTLDKRIMVHSWPKNNITRGCPRIKEQLVIASSGDIQLCCVDWLRTNKFGNINENSLVAILDNSKFLSMREDLMNGKRRKHYPCDRCEA